MRLPKIAIVVLCVSAGATVRAAIPDAPSRAARQVLVAAADAKGVPVRDLSPAEFIVRVDGKDATIIGAAPAVEPLSIVVVTEGFSRSSISDARTTLRAVVAAARRQHPDSRVGLMVGDGATPPHMLVVSEKADQLEREISRFFESPNTPLLDGILVAARTLSVEKSPRRLILAVTVGGGGGSTITPLRVAQEVRDAGAVLWALELGGGRALGSSEGRVLAEVTKSSGGHRETFALTSAAAQLDRVIGVIGAQYAVTFEAPTAGEVTAVAVRRRGLTIYAPVWAGLNLKNR